MTGILPLEYRVVLKVDELEETITTKGGVVLLKAFENEADRMRKAAKQEKATVIEIANNAFEDWAVKPKIGDKVIIAQFAGRNVESPIDKNWYRLVMDKEIEAIIKGEANEQ